MIVYRADNGEIIGEMPNEWSIDTFFCHHSNDYRNNLRTLNNDSLKEDSRLYRVMNGELIKKTEQEILDIQQFGRVLTEEERVNSLLAPSYEEIQKAQSTIEILSLLQEVM